MQDPQQNSERDLKHFSNAQTNGDSCFAKFEWCNRHTILKRVGSRIFHDENFRVGAAESCSNSAIKSELSRAELYVILELCMIGTATATPEGTPSIHC